MSQPLRTWSTVLGRLALEEGDPLRPRPAVAAGRTEPEDEVAARQTVPARTLRLLQPRRGSLSAAETESVMISVWFWLPRPCHLNQWPAPVSPPLVTDRRT